MAILTNAIVYLCSIFVLSLSWDITGVVCQLDVRFDVHDVVAIKKRAATMNCQISGQDAVGDIFWFKHRQPIQDKNIKMFSNGTLYFHVVHHKKTFSDSGIYQCCLKINSSALCSHDVQLIIAEMPKLSKHRSNHAYEVGHAVRFKCPVGKAVPNPKVTWYKDKEEIVPDHSISLLLSGILHLLNVSFDQVGRYRCQASNLAGQRNGPINTLNVTSTSSRMLKPFMVIGPEDTEIPHGGIVELECLMQGPSSMIVTWTRKDGKPIRNPIYTGRKNLRLVNAIPEDSGEYMCSAQVPGQSVVVNHSARVTVISLPIIKTGPMNSSQKMRLTKRLHCLVQGDSATKVMWYKDGQLSNGEVNTVTNDLVLYDLKFEDAGIYQCLATNKAGSVQMSARLEVWSAPSIPARPYNIQGVSTSSSEIMVMWLVDKQLEIIATTIYLTPVGEDRSSRNDIVVGEQTKTYIVKDLKPYTNYSIYLEVFTVLSASLPSETIYVVTNEAVPSRYPNFQLSSSHPTSIDVSWEQLAKEQCNGVLTNYKIVYKTSSTKVREKIVNATRLHATVKNLQPDTDYSIRMAAATKIGYGKLSDWTHFRTKNNLTTLFPSVEFYNVTNSSVTLQWKLIDGILIDGFSLKVSMSHKNEVVQQHKLPPETNQFVVNSLKHNTEYIIYVSVISDKAISSQTIFHVTTKDTISNSGPESKLPWPRDIHIHLVEYDYIVIQWKAPQTALLVNKYRLRYKTLNVNTWQYVVVNAISGEKQEATISNLQPFTWYIFTLQSIGVGVESGYSESNTIQTNAYKPQTPPADLRAKPIDAYSVQISWEPPQKPNGIITEYIILYNINNTSPEQQWEKQQRNGSETLSKVNNLLSNTEYFFRMKAKNHMGLSPPTDMVSARTLIATDIDEASLGFSNMSHGILLGIGISVPCIVACIICLILRKKFLGHVKREVVQQKNIAQSNVNCETTVTATRVQLKPVSNYNHLIMYQNKQRQFGNNSYHVPSHANSEETSSHDPENEVPLSIRLLSGEFDNDSDLLEDIACEVDPMLPRIIHGSVYVEDKVVNDSSPFVENSRPIKSTERVQTDEMPTLEMQTTSIVGIAISSGAEVNTTV